LHSFAGRMATVFPGTSTVESDFYVLKYSKDEFCSNTTDFSLEGLSNSKLWTQTLVKLCTTYITYHRQSIHQALDYFLIVNFT
jgi:hypothetical protein